MRSFTIVFFQITSMAMTLKLSLCLALLCALGVVTADGEGVVALEGPCPATSRATRWRVSAQGPRRCRPLNHHPSLRRAQKGGAP